MRIKASLRCLLPALIAYGVFLLGAQIVHAQQPADSDRATISPSVVNLQPGGTQRFKIVMVATRLMAADVPSEVRWAVNDIPGGNSEIGTIDANGVYRAPARIPSPREVHICAEVPQAANRFLWATVIVGEGRPTYRQHHMWSEPVIHGTRSSAHLTDPHGIALDREGNILIADQMGSSVHRYTARGEYIGRLDKGTGNRPGQVIEPRIVAIDVDGNIFVSDSKGDRPRLQVFSHEGEFLRIFAEKGMQPGMLLRAHGMGFDPMQRLYVVDVDNMRVSVYTREGQWLYDWGTEGLNPGEFNAPHGLFVDKNADVFVTGYYGPTQKFNSVGDYLLSFGHGDPPEGPVYFHNVAGDRWGNVYVMVRSRSGYQGALSDEGARHISIMKYNNNGDFITEWGFSTPEHTETTAVVGDDGLVYALFKGRTEMGVEVFVEE